MNQSILDRIAKLLEMTVANGCTEEEAASAASIAQKLCLKYNVSMMHAREKGSKSKASIDESKVYAPGALWVRYEWVVGLANAIADAFYCKVIFRIENKKSYHLRGDIHDIKSWARIGRFTFIGDPTNAEVASRIFPWLCESCIRIGWYNQEQTKKVQKGCNEKWLDAFWHGMVSRIDARLRENKKAEVAESPGMKEYGIEIFDEAEAYLLQKYPNLRKMKTRRGPSAEHMDAYLKGYEAGSTVSLSPTESLGAGSAQKR